MRGWGLGWWGADMLIVFSVLARSAAAIETGLLYHVSAGRRSAAATTPVRPEKNLPRRISTDLAVTRDVLTNLLQHAGYVLGYARIVSRVSDISLAERLALYRVILRKLVSLARRDLVGG
jgi:hypothetical protein